MPLGDLNVKQCPCSESDGVWHWARFWEKSGCASWSSSSVISNGCVKRPRCGGTVGIIANTKARLLQQNKVLVADDLWAQIVVWVVPTPVRGSEHEYKYSFALIDKDRCVLRYDNEAGKGDHKHIGEVELPYVFWTIDRLQDDFWSDVERYQREGASWAL